LKQVTFEPDERVKVQSADPTSLKSNYCIEAVEIYDSSIDDELSFAHSILPINTNLVAITGGKGSGKTAFVDLVANCYSDRKNAGDTNSFVRRITADGEPDLKVRITLKDGTVFEKNVSDPSYYEDSPIVYIAQGDLQSHVTHTETLEQHIGELIFESPKVKDTQKQFEYESLLAEAGGFSSKLQKKNTQIYALELKTTEAVETALTTDLAQHKAKVKDVSTRIAGIEKSQSKAKTEEAKKKQAELEKLRTRKQQLLELQEAVQAAIEFHSDSLPLFNDEVKKINSGISRLKLKADPYPEITYENFNGLEALDKTVTKELKATVAGIEKFQKEIQKTAEEFKLHTKLLDDKKTLEKAIVDVQKKITTLTAERALLTQIDADG
jgi:DNA repair exonuclease SbcCD ATPase subunit